MFQADQIDELAARARFGPKRKASGKNGVAVSSHPIVTRVATEVLRAGGNAVDAILAASAAQTVVEPHMTTICGMLSMMHYDAATGQTTYLNGAINAPKAGLPGFGPADAATGRGVGVPGFWAAWEAARERFASWPSDRLLAPAIELARTGFPIYPFLYGMMFEQVAKLGLTEAGRSLYFKDNALKNPGDRLVQNELADTLEQLAAKGHDYFYRSEFTRKVVDTVKAAGGVLTMEDFDDYQVRWVEPAWGEYRGLKVAGSPPPDNGGTHLIEILNLIELIPLKEWGPPTESADSLYWIGRFCNEVFMEGGKQRDPNSWPLPLETIVSKDYARIRFELMKMSEPRQPARDEAPYPGSNHLTVVDAKGNVATILHSVMAMPWSNGLIVDGVNIWAGAVHFLRQMPNPGDRGTVYVAPHIIFGKDSKPLIAAGSPSVGLIPNCIQNALNLIDFGLDIEASVHRPRVGGPSLATMLSANPACMVEVDCGDAAIHDAVRAKGLALDVVSPWNFHAGSYEGVHMPGDGLAEACADPRRAGAAEAA
jgi:gamma-glutamyltranspeptidase/glutathione hydrolase